MPDQPETAKEPELTTPGKQHNAQVARSPRTAEELGKLFKDCWPRDIYLDEPPFFGPAP